MSRKVPCPPLPIKMQYRIGNERLDPGDKTFRQRGEDGSQAGERAVGKGIEHTIQPATPAWRISMESVTGCIVTTNFRRGRPRIGVVQATFDAANDSEDLFRGAMQAIRLTRDWFMLFSAT